MDDVPEDLRPRIARIAADRLSGAAALRDDAIEVLRAVRGTNALLPVARALWAAQPSMAPLRNAAIEAIASGDHAARFERFAERGVRGSRLLARIAGDYFSGPADTPSRPRPPPRTPEPAADRREPSPGGGRADDHDRPLRVADDVFGDAADEQPADRAASVTADDDEVDVLRVGGLEDRRPGFALPHERSDDDAGD